MSPRAASRLESIGFEQVYDYTAGKVDWGSFGSLITSESSREAFVLSLQTSGASTLLCVLVGVPMAVVLARTEFRGQGVVHSLVPGIPWAAAIALGAIVAPPDAAAASAILRQLHIPHRMVVILEGESLLNDATALLIYRLAVSAAMGSTFSAEVVGWQALAMLGSVVAGFVLAHTYIRMVAWITDIPSAIIPVFTIPVAIIISFIPMKMIGVSSNIMSLGGIAIAIGAMVDASIIRLMRRPG